MALIAVTHALAAQTFYPGMNTHVLEIRPISADLDGHAIGIEDTEAAKLLSDRHAGCGHAAALNSVALARLGFESTTTDPSGGIIERDSEGLTGIVKEAAAERAFRALPVPDFDAMAQAMDAVIADYLACGVTGATEAAVGFTAGFDAEWSFWKSFRKRSRSPIRMSFMLAETAADMALRDIRPSSAPDWQVDTLKFFADGVIGNRSAAMRHPYLDRPQDRGILMSEAPIFRAEILAAVKDGWNVAVHAIGDSAINIVAEAFHAAHQTHGSRRLRVEHLALPTDHALNLLRQAEAIIVPQYGFLAAMGDGFMAAVGEERAAKLYPGYSLLKAGFHIAGSSDAPATPMSPFYGMAAAVSRRTSGGHTLAVEERMSAQEALHTYTVGGAYAGGFQGLRGQLCPGAYADLAVLDRDPIHSTSEEIASTSVLATFVGGQLAFKHREAIFL
ncbi:hypothetical protein BG36_19030 [Aquamicrobium defluvii]|uniref:Amidohydrolase 3 domain-containing protein n=1 Tax=Aquamicrobium defluvii TaxID=69279 RepID=A0A011TC90_9HYPH|nr:hypothetical protein BG36_19030 [Aquamicrobium defluvii]EZQ12725.1 hypothetical protein CF98_34705 [Halopseudomonas bauzanensis]